MARNPRFERSSISPDGSNFPRRGTSLHVENLPLSQVLLLDKLSIGDHTYRHPELKPVTNAVVGTVAEDPLLGPVQAKPLSSLGVEELKRVRSCVTENSLKARERINFLNEAIYKLDRYHRPVLPRKRSQIELPAPVPNKQVHTSMKNMQVEERPYNMPRSSVMTDRERDILRSAKDASQLKHEDQTLTVGSESRKKAKMTGRYSGTKLYVSVKVVANRMLDGDSDYKQGIQQRSSTDSHSRPSESNGFRSNVCNKNHAASSTEGKGSRAYVKSAPNVSHNSPTFDSQEQTSNPNRGQITGGAKNYKRPFSLGSSSTHVTQWSEQKPPRHQHTKRTNLVEGSSISKSVAKRDSTESSGQGILRCSFNNSAFQQSRLKTENISSLAALSESEELGAADKCKNKIKKQGDADEKIAPVCEKVGSLVLPLIKEKTVTKKESGDGVQRPRRSGRDGTPLRMNPPLSGKLENAATTKQLRSTTFGTDKPVGLFSKTDRSPTKKTSLDRKPVTQLRCPMNSGLSYFLSMKIDNHCSIMSYDVNVWPAIFVGDLDDSEELLAAVNASKIASDVACSGPFWKQMGPFFAPLTRDDLDFLKHLVEEVEDDDAILISPPASNQTGEADLVCSMLPANSSPNMCVDNESLNPFINLNAKEDIERPGKFRCFDRMLPLSQRLLSALIVEEDCEETHRKLYDGPQDDCLHRTSEDCPHGNCTQIESDTENAEYRGLDERHAHRGQTFGLISSIAAYDIQSQEMDLDQRILLELQSIGLFPESVPDLAHREDEEIKMEICKLKDELQQQVSKNKRHLHKLEKAVFKRQKVEEREREVLAMNKLVESAYNRHMGLRGTNASGRKSAQNKVTKQATLDFVKRTLSKCRMFEETGKSCFSDASLKERMFSISSKEMDKKLIGDTVKGDTANVLAALGTTLPGGAKRKRTTRDREGKVQTKEIITRSSSTRSDRPDLGNAKGEVKSKLKPRQKTAQLSAAVNDLGKVAGAQKSSLTSNFWEKPSDKMVIVKDEMPASQNSIANDDASDDNIPIDLSHLTAQLSAAANDLGKVAGAQKSSLTSNYWEKPSDKMVIVKDEMPASQNSIANDDASDDNIPIDLSHLQLPNLEDFDSWLNFEDDSLPDADSYYMGLAVPMDDLADLNMF
ncbi:uncharacterized protein LOC131063071 [Cryptomeria japonica]|uniref:uncharacterized protein LOC131063071 n=1 Tax=Cryptomeria japonica TaxID=3369 RepID=UPI0027DA3CF3|nr:uncharacterized protein LOC131063071 [Cryptomeria japonica]